MKKLLRGFGVISSAVFATALFLPALQPTSRVPLPPQAGENSAASSTPAQDLAQTLRTSPPDRPLRLSIPSLSLDDAVVEVGINDKGEMDVPDGGTRNVGWYKYGTVPGEKGSAVMDAHVFAAFADLKRLREGNKIDVKMSKGDTLTFTVTKTVIYPVADVPAEELFNKSGGRYLNLITCAGSLLPDHSTYDHRLVVYATLVGS